MQFIIIKLLIVLSFSLTFYSCSKTEIKEDEFFDTEYIEWHNEIVSGDSLFANDNILVQGNFILVPVRSFGGSGVSFVACLNKENGNLLWTWNDHFRDYGSTSFSKFLYAYDNILVVNSNNLLYGINIETGKTIWHERRDFLGLIGVRGNQELICRQILEVESFVGIEIGNVYTGEWEEVFRFQRQDSFFVFGSSPVPFKKDGKEYLSFIISKEIPGANRRNYSWLYLFDLDERKTVWISDTIRENNPQQTGFPLATTPGLVPEYQNEKIVFGDQSIFCYDFETGTERWKKYFGNSFSLNTNLTIGNNTIYGNNEDQYLIGLDLENGIQKFKTVSGGSTSKIIHLDDRIYVSAVTVGGPNRLLVLDDANGQVIHNIRAPFYDRQKREYQFFAQGIAVDEDTKKVFVTDHKNVICYKSFD